MEREFQLPSGEWNGFYLERHQPQKGWMHLYLEFKQGKIAGEGTDYIGPWTASGNYDPESGLCSWVKQYLGKHQVVYQGKAGEQGIQGNWKISYLTGEFHIWPKSMGYLNELYLQAELQYPIPGFPSIPLGTVPVPAEEQLV